MEAGRVLAASSVLLVFYFLLAGSVSFTEAVAGFGCVVLVSVLVARLHGGEHRRQRVRPPLRLPIRIALSLLLDTVRVGRVLCRVIVRRPRERAGTILSMPFESGAERPDDAGRRGLVTLAASLAPNGFVLAVPRGRDRLVMHRLAPSPTPSDHRWPV